MSLPATSFHSPKITTTWLPSLWIKFTFCWTLYKWNHRVYAFHFIGIFLSIFDLWGSPVYVAVIHAFICIAMWNPTVRIQFIHIRVDGFVRLLGRVLVWIFLYVTFTAHFCSSVLCKWSQRVCVCLTLLISPEHLFPKWQY